MDDEVDNAQIEFIDDDGYDDDVEAIKVAGQAVISLITKGASFDEVTSLVDEGVPLWYQDEEGLTALHAAAFREDENIVEYLLEKGAIWNAVDFLGNTAGDVALSLNNEKCYRLIRDAGIRSEYLLSHLSSQSSDLQTPSALILRSEDTTSSGSSEEFLKSRLNFTKDVNGQDVCLVKSGNDEVGVMMGWERNIMQETVQKLCHTARDDLKVLNVGFGLGIIDLLFQSLSHPPKQHCIIEAHPDVIHHMRSNGWHEKPGVTILEGKWQEFLTQENIAAMGRFDVIYTDTFSENYQDLHEFFRQVPMLLNGPSAKFGFFNGLGATNALFYDVYTQLSELHLSNIDLDVTWHDVDVGGDGGGDDVWGETRKYFTMRNYRLPVAQLKSKDTSS